MVLCKGSDVRPGVPWSPVALRGRRGTWCSARGRMYALASLGLRWLLRGRRGTWCSARVGCTPCILWSPPPLCRWLLRGRRGTWCSARGRMYALASLGLGSRLLFAWQAQHLLLCKGSDVRPGVPWSPPPLKAGGFCVAGAAHGALQGVGCIRPGVP